MHKGPVTVIATEYGTRLDNQPLSRSATVDGVPDFVNLYEYDDQDRWIARSHDPDGDGPLGFTDTYFVYDGTPPSGSLLDRAAVTLENIGQIVLHFEADAQGDPQLAHRYLWAPAVDQILADEQVTDPTAPGNIVWPLTDHLNTVRDLGRLRRRHRYHQHRQPPDLRRLRPDHQPGQPRPNHPLRLHRPPLRPSHRPAEQSEPLVRRGNWPLDK